MKKTTLVINFILTVWLLLLASPYTFAKVNCAAKLDIVAANGPLMSRLKTAIVQYPVDGAKNTQDFIGRVSGFVGKAAQQNANVIVFPELFSFDMLDLRNGEERILFEQIAAQFPALIESFKDMSRLHNIAILAGSMPRQVAGRIRNTAAMIFPDGKTIYQDKIFLTPDEVDWNWQPGTEITVFDTPWGKSAILICHDCEFPILSNMIAPEFPEIIFVPSMTEGVEGFRRVRWSAQARAIEHRAYVLHTGTVGQIPGGWNNYAQASALGPSERGFTGLIAEGKAGQTDMLITELDMDKLRAARQSRGIFPARSQTRREEPLTLKRGNND